VVLRDYSPVSSSTGAEAAFALTEAMPFFAAGFGCVLLRRRDDFAIAGFEHEVVLARLPLLDHELAGHAIPP
jgi:hypothetical protein